MMRMRAQAKNLELILDVSSAVPRFAHSDAEKLRRILINLLDNAVKYTESGKITLRVDARPGSEPKRRMLTFQVLDTGIGISPEDQARIFDPFVQVGKEGVRKGAGLGLSITRKLVELMGGTITVEGRLGAGSCFRVDVPVERAEESEAKTLENDSLRIPVLAPGHAEYRVLIVEDDRESALLLERMLQDAGFQVRVAEDGERGIEIFLTLAATFHLDGSASAHHARSGSSAANSGAGRRARSEDRGRSTRPTTCAKRRSRLVWTTSSASRTVEKRFSTAWPGFWACNINIRKRRRPPPRISPPHFARKHWGRFHRNFGESWQMP